MSFPFGAYVLCRGRTASCDEIVDSDQCLLGKALRTYQLAAHEHQLLVAPNSAANSEIIRCVCITVTAALSLLSHCNAVS